MTGSNPPPPEHGAPHKAPCPNEPSRAHTAPRQAQPEVARAASRRRAEWGGARPPARRAPQEAGFTLLEIVIAMVILGIGLLALGLAQIQSIKLTSSGKHLSQAMYLAEEQLDLFLAMPTTATVFQTPATSADPLNPIDLDPNDNDATTFNRSWTITPGTPAIGMTSISVQVDWLNPLGTSGQTSRTVTLQGVK